MADVFHVKLPSGECHWTLLINQLGSGAVRQQAIAWANVDPDLHSHMAPLGPNGLNLFILPLCAGSTE